ncbi:endolytic transglycosylase MltG [Acidihalobacter prosperus]|uniref:Endolytic murein transglycosylase n=1 Tax=Acidihalobacter prosperus TaxID=160660 RepID=A0A1A6C883_9GAMM|nr:endolytic transglycosylase MltG [Acidihalobacter prosperus]OBS10759.1 hypothetical protein Thpro_020475 [Acidihalobacter prosperus]
MRKSIWALLWLALILALPATMAWRHLHTPMSLPTGQAEFDVPAGSTARQVAERLHARQILRHPTWWLLYARLSRQAAHIQSGDYMLRTGMTPLQLLDDLVAGRTVQYGVTLIDGWSFAQVMKVIDADPHIKHTLKPDDYKDLIHRLGGPKGMSPEGWFYPNTYFFSNGATDVSILQRAYRAMRRHLARAWADRAPDLPIKTPYDALILASIVEKETGSPKERPLVASVFVNRLRLGMRLQSDPTVIYGLGKRYHGDLTFKGLRSDTPYNTYVHKGLPPTPIALPSGAAIDAVMHPANTQYLYFVATGKGTHVFSKTYAEQQKAVIKYQLGGNAARYRADAPKTSGGG